MRNVINSAKRITRTVDGVTFTKSPYTGAWVSDEHGISVRPTYTGNLCSKIQNYVIETKQPKAQWTRRSFMEALRSAVEFINHSKEPVNA